MMVQKIVDKIEKMYYNDNMQRVIKDNQIIDNIFREILSVCKDELKKEEES